MVKKIYKLGKEFFGQISKDDIFIYAAQSAFYMITASIPFMMLFLALLKFIMPISENDAISVIKTIVPVSLKDVAETVMHDLFSKTTAIVSITSITAMWSASRGVAAVERGVKKVYGTKKRRNFFKNVGISLLYTVVFLIALLITLIIMVFGGTIYEYASHHFEWIVNLENVFGGVQGFMYFLGFSIFFTFTYRILAGREAKVKDQILGALFTTLGWYVFSFVFSLYVEKFANYSYVYGSLSVIVLMMLWIYFCLIILLIGAEFNVFVKKKEWLYK